MTMKDRNQSRGSELQRASEGQERGGMQRRGEGRGELGRYGGRGGLMSPFSMMRRMMEDMDRLFGEFGMGGAGFGELGDFGEREMGLSRFEPQVEVLERDDKLVVRADLPGIKKEDVNVSIEENALCIEGERKSEHEEEKGGVLRSERSYGKFVRTIPLPRGIDLQSCDASFENGVLEITVDKPKESRKQIQVKSGERRGEPRVQGQQAGQQQERGEPRSARENGTAPSARR